MLGCGTVILGGIIGYVIYKIASLFVPRISEGIILLLVILCGALGYVAYHFLVPHKYKLDYEADKKEKDKKYQEALKAYDNVIKGIDEKYETDMNEYKRKLDEDKLRVEAEERQIKELNNLIKTCTENYEQTKKALNKFYEDGPIYKKYCYLIAFSSILEYLDSGRCYELEGPNGAYNIFETEIRQDIIIDKLETVISNLEQIRKNQYILYTAIEHANDELRSLKANMRTSLKYIANNTARAENFAQITALNTRALMWISTIDTLRGCVKNFV